VVLIIAVIALVFLAAVYARDLDRTRLFGEYSNQSGASRLILASLPELWTIYLAKSFFACEESDRAAKPPLERPLSHKEKRRLYSKVTLLAFIFSAVLRLGVTAALSSLAGPRLYALSQSPATFASRLLQGINLSPVISGGVYMITLLSFAFALSLLAQFSREM
jgi:hypothetical protein